MAIAGDLKQAFLQIRVRREDRDALRFHWIKDLASKQVETLRFTRVLFGLAPSPFLLATFKLHKWHFNDRELEVETATVDEESQSYAKQQLGTRKGESKLLGVPWDKEKDEIQVSFPISTAEPTKRGILGKVAKIYDPLGLASPVTLSGIMLYRDACDTKIAWDRPLPSDLQAKWKKWEQGLPEHVNAPRNVVKHLGKILSIDLHKFGDASGKGVAAAVNAVMEHESRPRDGKVAAREERTHDSPIRTSGWTYGCEPSTKCERSPEGFSR